jgi:hypothetical protein
MAVDAYGAVVQGITCSYVMKSKKRNNPPRPSSGPGSTGPKVRTHLVCAGSDATES